MELFKLACPTCATWLKVSQASAIGQILACPKCGGMIHVQPPEGFVLPPELATPAAPPAAPQRRPVDPNLPATASQSFGDFDDVDSLLSPTATAKPAAGARIAGKKSPAPASAQAPARAATVRPPADPFPLPVDAHTMSASAQHRRRMLLLYTVVVILLVASGVAVALLVNNFMNSWNRQRLGQGDSAAAPGTDDPLEHPPRPANDGSDAAPEPANAGETEPALTFDLPPPPPLGVPRLTAAADPAPPDDGPHPPGFDPVRPNSGGSPTIAPTLVDQFGSLNELLPASENQLSLKELEDVSAPDRGRIGIPSLVVRKSDARPVDLAARLNDPILAYESGPVSLVEALRTLSAASTIPVAYDLDVILAAKIDLLSPVDLTSGPTTLGAVIDQLLQSRGLSRTIGQRALRVTIPDRDAISPRRHALHGLAEGNGERGAALLDLFTTVFGDPPAEGDAGETAIALEGDELVLRQTAAGHAVAAEVIEKLAAARRLAADPNDDSARQTLASRARQTAESRQATVVGPGFYELPLEGLFSIIERDAGVVIVVDWEQVLEEDWSPDAHAVWPQGQWAIGHTLNEIAAAMRLTVRDAGPRFLELTTVAQAEARRDVEIYPCGDLLTQYDAGQLATLLTAPLGGLVDPAAGIAIRVDPLGKCVIAVAPQALQVRLERILDKLR